VIRSRAELADYLARDAEAHGVDRWTWRSRLSPRSRDRILLFQRRLRMLEYLANTPRKGPRLLTRLRLSLLWRRHLRHGERLGFTVPLNTFGPGLCLAHHGTIVVSEHARIGAGARVHPATSIGLTDAGAPQAGDGLYLGPGARLVGAIRLGRDVTVGANAVVLDDFGDGAVLVGAPARQVAKRQEHAWRH
jgi:serine O-acetyltransferase